MLRMIRGSFCRHYEGELRSVLLCACTGTACGLWVDTTQIDPMGLCSEMWSVTIFVYKGETHHLMKIAQNNKLYIGRCAVEIDWH